MKKNLFKLLAGFVLLLAVAYVGIYSYSKFYQNGDEEDVVRHYMTDIPIEPSQFKEDFDDIHRQVVKHYKLYKQKGISMDSLYNVFAEKLKNEVKTKTDYSRMLMEYFASLNSGNCYAYFKEYTANFCPTLIDGRVFVNTLNDYLHDNGFREKDEIVSIDGIKTKDWIETNRKYFSGSTPEAKTFNTAMNVFNNPIDSVRIYTVKRDNDTLTLCLPLKKSEYFGVAPGLYPVEYKQLNASVGYIAINSMKDESVELFDSAYNKVKKLPFLIIDIRRNCTGSSENGIKICQSLLKNEQPHCMNKKTIMTPNPNTYKGKLFLLIDTYTYGAAECFAIDLLESGNVTLVGKTTGGDAVNSIRTYCSRHGIYFRLPTHSQKKSPKDFQMEGIGIKPHYMVEQNVIDFLDDRDTQLNYILNWLGGDD